MGKLIETMVANVTTVLGFLVVIIVLFVVGVLLEKMGQMKRGVKEKLFTTRKVAMIGMFSALSAVLMLIEFPVPFAPPFYKLDFSELPILIGTFAFGPMAGVMMEFVKILLKLCIKGTSTAFVGELANFSVGCSFILTASGIYVFKKTKKNAILACVCGTLVMTIFGTGFNAVYLIPAFSKLYGIPMEAILQMGTAVNPLVKESSILSFVAACVAPLNLIKGVCVSVITLLVYKPLSPIIKAGQQK
ncbi:MAG: ECF transporter S component [Lachnospiraceae bacterium]|nr:ECF transporter S component [Lachnospiraceae bacterium]